MTSGGELPRNVGRNSYSISMAPLVDSVYQHVLAWREALEEAGIELAVWRIHPQIGMSGYRPGARQRGDMAIIARYIPSCAGS